MLVAALDYALDYGLANGLGSVLAAMLDCGLANGLGSALAAALAKVLVCLFAGEALLGPLAASNTLRGFQSGRSVYQHSPLIQALEESIPRK